MAENETPKQDEVFEVAELDDQALEDAAGGGFQNPDDSVGIASGNENCGCGGVGSSGGDNNTNCGCP